MSVATANSVPVVNYTGPGLITRTHWKLENSMSVLSPLRRHDATRIYC